MSTVALRAALIWHDEVMNDVVLEKPTTITVGHVGKPTFVVPDIGLPKHFAIVRPGNRGYLLTLGDRMRGTICVDGREQDVAQFVRAGGAGGAFHATPISGRDWGVIDLDETGTCKLFFQFVPIEDAQPFFTKTVIMAGLAGYLMTIIALGTLFYLRGITTDWLALDSASLAEFIEGLFRGFLIASVVLGIAALIWWIILLEPDKQASLAFSVVLHAFLLFMTYQLYDPSDPFVWPGPRALTGNYLATRLEPMPEPKTIPTVGPKSDGAAAAKTPEPPKKTATKNSEGEAGGEGKRERRRDPDAIDAPPTPKVGIFEDKNSKLVNETINRNLETSLNKFAGIPGERREGDLGFGTGRGTGVGEGFGTGTTRGGHGHGTGGGGQVEGDFNSDKGPVDTGKMRPGGGTCAKPPCGTSPREVKVSIGENVDTDGLTAEEINRVVKARAGVFRACYQKELNRQPGLGGKLVMHFVIGGDGIVKSAKTGGGSSMRNDNVEDCVNRQIMSLHFPAKGGLSNVNYPFVFQPGG
ncbi:MAG TPA: AgmX/PglI C-terminal domain-containing protein [Kofleriaceae bacterium]|nr:AgmX/PglI C-terminal domain-containing protein [Kofleriaceae bacterium]